MSANTKKTMQQAMAYVQQHTTSGMGDKEIDALLRKYIDQNFQMPVSPVTEETAEDVYDWMELADNARTKKERRRFLLKAREADPDDLDVDVALAELDAKDDPLTVLEWLPPVLEKAKALLKKEKIYFESRGNFWSVLETQPYMLALWAYMRALISCTKMKSAIKVGEEMMRLCKDDNLGIRFTLVHLYAYLEDQSRAERLYKKGSDDSVYYLMPLALISFKLGEMDKAKEYLQKAHQMNPNLKKFLTALDEDTLDHLERGDVPRGYIQPGDISELFTGYEEYTFLWDANMVFIHWAREALVVHRKRKTEK